MNKEVSEIRLDVRSSKEAIGKLDTESSAKEILELKSKIVGLEELLYGRTAMFSEISTTVQSLKAEQEVIAEKQKSLVKRQEKLIQAVGTKTEANGN